LDKPQTVEKLECTFNAKDFGIKFKKDATMIKESLLGLDRERLQCIKDELDSQGWVQSDEMELMKELLRLNVPMENLMISLLISSRSPK
jgi:glycyl-tRNA synthetase (class II)